MPKISLPLGGGYYISDAVPQSVQTCENLYPQYPLTKGASSPVSLLRTPGISSLTSLGGSSVGRGMYKDQKRGHLYQVQGTSLIKQTNTTSPTLIGTIDGSGYVPIADNGLVMVIIVPGVKGYFYTYSTGTLVEITDAIFLDFMAQDGGVTSVVEKDQRFVYNTDEEFFLGSDISVNDGKDFAALDFEDAETKTDPIVRVMDLNNELYVFGSETIELYQNIGGTAFPFQRILGATIDKGLKSRFGVVPVNRNFMFIGNGTNELPSIWVTGSGVANNISNQAIDSLIQGYTDTELESVKALSYSQDGSTFACFVLPNETIVFDVNASSAAGLPIWHLRKTGGTRWNVNDCVTIFNKVLVQTNDGQVGEMSRSFTQEFGSNVTRKFTSPYIINKQNGIKVNNVELMMTFGVGTDPALPTSTNASNVPVIEMKASFDQGNTFKSLGTREIGEIGQFNKRTNWRRVGRFTYVAVFEFETSSPVNIDLWKIDLDIEGLRN